MNRGDRERGPDPVRLAAAGILERQRRSRSSIDRPLRAAAASFGERDRRLLWNLVQETLRWRGRLDAVLEPLLHHPLKRLDPPIPTLLRLSACQVCVLDQIPGHAIVDEAVRLARRFCPPGAERLVNAVSRRLVADGRARWEEVGGDTRIESWPAVHSHPAWLVGRWRARWGTERALAILRWNNERAPVWIRARGDPPGPPAEPGWVPGTYQMPPGFLPAEEARFLGGAWTAQDPGETLVGLLAPGTSEGIVFDLCAAPGTKTTHLAERFGAERVVAMDRSRQRLRLLRETLERVGAPVDLLLADARSVPLRPGGAAGVLVDAPCSALGVLRRRVDARWNVRPGDLAAHGARQENILDQAASLPRPGGWLLYCVCSTEPEETERVHRRFLARHPEYRPGPLPPFLPERLVVGDGTVRILPGEAGCDGVYVFLVERKGVEG